MTGPDLATVDLTTRLADVTFETPVMSASGCGGSGRELATLMPLRDVSAFVTASLRRDAGPGTPAPRVLETAAGLLTATGLPGPGVDGFLARDLPWLLQEEARPIVSITGGSLGEYAELARRVGQTPGVTAIEVALGWPGSGAPAYAADPAAVGRVTTVVRRETPRGLPVLVKLAADAPDLLSLAGAAIESGADALVVGGSPAGLVLDPVTLRPGLPGRIGALSGPAVLPLALHAVWRIAETQPGIPLVGSGGIAHGADALAFLAAGATAVQVGTALLHDPTAIARIVDELRAALHGHGLDSASAAVGIAHHA